MTQMTENADLEEQLIDDIADALAQRGFIHLQHLLPKWLALQLMHEAQRLAAFEFKPAGIGRNNHQQVNSQVRTDSTLWLRGNSLTQQAYLDWMEQLRMGLNRRLFMGLFDFECHFSHYSTGDFYQRHLDAFKGRSNRILSSVFYLNPHWSESDGGELLLYADEQPSPLLVVPPEFNSCILFLSDVFPHEVLASHSDRFSIAGWYRVNSQSSDRLDPNQ
ncbi:2OG-Fe(II) oxygenase [Paraglaciecola sp. MB-3u-78]|uniref:2OG-Fe(II) oxygenase n=1 Tax=Paraglaciecola sp. MB-3u-78 TaxID=2058332 RepID=UPI000C34B685|nr:2OG-Fe(II) oxygenase [Paraglaciecola sp. MB-3u-78]PKH00333.1 proline hydroxylase [Paraglaciecola sp. MB-3u-78]